MTPIEEKHQSLGGDNGLLGSPLQQEEHCPDQAGRYRHFQGGSIHWHPDRGVFETHGIIRDKWAYLGWERGLLGYPICDERDLSVEGLQSIVGHSTRLDDAIRVRESAFVGGRIIAWGVPERDWETIVIKSDGSVINETPIQDSKGYSEEGFWDKLFRFAKAAGREVVEKALLLYYASQEPLTPIWAKMVVYGSLAYFIYIPDAIPDFIPIYGYSDDLAVMVAAIATISFCINDNVKSKTADKLKTWFGE